MIGYYFTWHGKNPDDVDSSYNILYDKPKTTRRELNDFLKELVDAVLDVDTDYVELTTAEYLDIGDFNDVYGQTKITGIDDVYDFFNSKYHKLIDKILKEKEKQP